MEISLFYSGVQNILDDMIYNSWDVECDQLKLVIMGHFLSFYPPPPPLLPYPLKTQYNFWDTEWET